MPCGLDKNVTRSILDGVKPLSIGAAPKYYYDVSFFNYRTIGKNQDNSERYEFTFRHLRKYYLSDNKIHVSPNGLVKEVEQ